MLEGRKGEKVKDAEKLTYDLKRNIDVEYRRRAISIHGGLVEGREEFLPLFQSLADAHPGGAARRVQGQERQRRLE
jgi:hypothetical protein